ncbi:MAG: shikimate kinase [Nitrospirota bacterium]|nr:shikimate kinase [Nitrospirota bacterium]
MMIVLIGSRGTGKSTVATIVGEHLGWQTVSIDGEIVRLAQLSIPEIVKQFGWDHFRTLESEVCQSLATSDHLVIDTGGGVIIRKENVRALKPNAKVFWLTANISTISQRIGGDTQRPSLTEGKTFIQEIEEVLEQRNPLYQAAADFVINTDGRSTQAIADEILAHFSDPVS